MPSPFPGMDPYLESPALSPDVHHGLIGQIQAVLNPRLRPRYVARVELRVTISNDDDPGRRAYVPDVRVEKAKRKGGTNGKVAGTLTITEPHVVPESLDELEEAYLEIRQVGSGALVTVIEVLSPANKVEGACSRAAFLDKRREMANARVHWVEIDLLRGGLRTMEGLEPSDYRVLLRRVDERTRYWPVSVREALPVIAIPLRDPDPDVPLDLGTVLQAAYERASYELSVDYRKKPDPPLKGPDARWAAALLRAAKMR